MQTPSPNQVAPLSPKQVAPLSPKVVSDKVAPLSPKVVSDQVAPLSPKVVSGQVAALSPKVLSHRGGGVPTPARSRAHPLRTTTRSHTPSLSAGGTTVLGLNVRRGGDVVVPVEPYSPIPYAFTLIEFIGILAVIAILAALTVPSVIRQIDHAANTREIAELSGISDSITHHVLTNKTIPPAADLASTVAAWTGQPLARVQKTPRGYTRAFLTDGGGWLTNVASSSWTQTSAGLATSPTRARMMIVSCISSALPIISSQLSATDFDNLWNTEDGVKPSSWGWLGRPDDLHIQRVNLEPLFYHLVLVNRDPPGAAQYAIDSTITLSLTNVLRRYFLSGTDLGLYNAGMPPVAQTRALLDQDRSYVFQAGRWADQLNPGDDYSEVTGNRFAALAGEFLASDLYSGAHKGGNQQGTVIAMFDFMLTYQLWANQCPHFPKYGNPSADKVPEYQLLSGVAAGQNSSSLLNSFSGTDGLLK